LTRITVERDGEYLPASEPEKHLSGRAHWRFYRDPVKRR
jgi:hypothetical protein